ncbi:IS3 family transposase [bacterium]|nr:IS3 family transposase [bacterium]
MSPSGTAARRDVVADQRGSLTAQEGCALMDLSRSTYYYRSPVAEAQAKERLDLQDKIEQLAFDNSGYGYRRITAELHRQGVIVNHKVVLKIMRESDLLVRPLRGFIITTDSKHHFPVYPNLYQNQWPDAPNRIWVADITYIRLPLGFVYLAVILDVFSRKVIGWALSRSMEATLVIEALQMALQDRKPPPGLIHHSDRGVQYACHAYTDLLKQHGVQINMSRKGNPYDNAVAESFFKTLKKEEVYLSDYQTPEEARRQIQRFIELVYNPKRLHSALGYRPPAEFEMQYNQTQTAA